MSNKTEKFLRARVEHGVTGIVKGRRYKVVAPRSDDLPSVVRIIDESGEDYVYPKHWFEDASTPPVDAVAQMFGSFAENRAQGKIQAGEVADDEDQELKDAGFSLEHRRGFRLLKSAALSLFHPDSVQRQVHRGRVTAALFSLGDKSNDDKEPQ